MAKDKKAAKELTMEEKLAQALVPVEEQPYKIPENWCWVHLCDSFNNHTNSKKKIQSKEYQGNGKLAIIDQGKELIGGYTDDESMAYSGELPVIIFGDHTRCIKFIDFPFVQGADGVKVIEPKKFYDVKAFYYALQSIDMPNMGYRRHFPLFSQFFIPVPPLEEQCRIAKSIDSIFAKLDEAKEKAQAVVDGFELRKSAILHKAFTGELTKQWRRTHQVTFKTSYEAIQKELSMLKIKETKKVINNVELPSIPIEWKFVELCEIAKKITDGEHSTPRRVDKFCGYYLLSARNVRDDELKLDDVDYVDKEEYEKISSRCNPKKNDILISCSGSVGRSCVINDDNCYVMVRSAALISTLMCNPRFVMYMLMSKPVQKEIKQLSKQTAQANLFIGAIAAIKIPFPAIEEQNKIVEIVDRMMEEERKSRDLAQNVIYQIYTMKKAVLARAFRGELGTNDPTEEAAIELLKIVL